MAQSQPFAAEQFQFRFLGSQRVFQSQADFRFRPQISSSTLPECFRNTSKFSVASNQEKFSVLIAPSAAATQDEDKTVFHGLSFKVAMRCSYPQH